MAQQARPDPRRRLGTFRLGEEVAEDASPAPRIYKERIYVNETEVSGSPIQFTI